MPPTLDDEALDQILDLQLAVAWAGEQGERGGGGERLGWWPTDLTSEDGGVAFLRHLAPKTYVWAAFQAAREAARQVDRRRLAAPEALDERFTLFHLGAELDERLDERLVQLKREGDDLGCLPQLAALREAPFSQDRFAEWVASFGAVEHDARADGRALRELSPRPSVALVRALVAALSPHVERYPAPYARRSAP